MKCSRAECTAVLAPKSLIAPGAWYVMTECMSPSAFCPEHSAPWWRRFPSVSGEPPRGRPLEWMDTAAADRCLRPRDCGVRLAQGPWQALGGNTWGVPVVTEMEHWPRPDYTLKRSGREFEWVKARKEEKREQFTDEWRQ